MRTAFASAIVCSGRAALAISPSVAGRGAALRPAWPGAVGLVSAVLVVASFARFGATGHAVVGAFLAPTLVLLSAIDLERHLLPNRIVLPATAVILVLQTAFYPSQAPEWAGAGLAAASGLLLLLVVYPPGLGMGDVKLALLLGVALGKAVLAAIVIGLFLSGLAGVVLLLTQGAAARKRTIPLGPFLAFGALLLYFIGS
jgi:prepilin signal peptidase PulO-like enzyme (type II secretory pathway)